MKRFSFNTIQDFDKHILASIPNYDILFNSILCISKYFYDKNMTIYDIGCSTGKLLKSIKFDCKKVGIDNSRNLLPESKNGIEWICTDLNDSFEFKNASIIYSIFILQFLKKKSRYQLLTDIYNGLNPGGALIIAEKTYSEFGQFQEIFTFSYYDYKRNSFTGTEILDKEDSLREILKPNTSKENEELLMKVGFKKIERFFKYFNFEAFLCIK